MPYKTFLRIGLAAAFLFCTSSILAAAPIRVTGRVQAEKAGLSGARVELFPAYEEYAEAVRRLTGKTGPVPLAKTRTDAAGDFEILAPESGCFRLEVRAEGYLAQEITLLPLVEDVELPAATLMQGSPVEVRTAGPDGRPLGGIEVQPLGSPLLGGMDRMNWELIAPQVTTDSAGRGSFPWLQLYGPPPVIAVSPRFLGQGAHAKPGEAVTLRLVPTRSGGVEVRNAEGQPVPGALARWSGRPVGITGPDGRLEIAVPEQASALTLENAEGGGAQVFRTVAEGLQPIRLEPPRRIAGRVVDALSRKPVAGAVVWSGSPLLNPAVHSGEDGSFVLTVPAAAAEVWLIAGAAGFLRGESQEAGKGAVEPVLLKLAPAAALSGTVVDGSGKPVRDARIHLRSSRWGEGIVFVDALARSRADGGFRFSQLPPGESFELSATHPGFARTAARARTVPFGQPSPPLRIVMAGGRTAFGRVVDEEDRPIAGAQVTLTSQEGVRDLFEAVSDGTGRFELRTLPPGGRGYLKATHPGYAAAFLDSIEISPAGPDIDLGNVKMLPPVAVEGRVTDSRARPIEGAQVLVQPDRTSFTGGSWVVREKVVLRTGADGSFRAESLERDRRYDLTVRHEGYANASLPGVEAPTAEPLRIEMKAIRTLSGQVVGPAGEPVAGASLNLLDELRIGHRASWGSRLLGRTDEVGRFRVDAPPSDSILLEVSAEGYAPRRVEGLQIPEDGELANLRITLSRGGVLDVRVLNREGVPVVDAWVRVSPAAGPAPGATGESKRPTDSTGQCRIIVPEAGVYEVTAEASGAAAVASVRVVPGPEVTPVELRFSSGVAVSGRVIGEDGAGTAGAAVSLDDETGRGPGTTTAADGSFVFPLVFDDDYRLRARWEDFQADPLDVTVAGSPVQGLELRLRLHKPEKGRASLTVRILGLTPEEIPKVRITASGPDSPTRYGRPDSDGVHRFERLRPGSWYVTATAGDREAHGTVQIPDGAAQAALDLVFRKGLTLTGRVLVDGAPLSSGSVDAWSQDNYIVSARTAHDGTFTLGSLAAGPVTLLIAGSQGFAGLHTVQLTEDQEVALSLVTGRLAGRVLTATGEPVEGATVSLEAWLPDFGGPVSAPGGRTGADGAFDIPGLGAGPYQIKVRKEGFVPAEATAEVPAGGSSAPVSVVLRPREERTP